MMQTLNFQISSTVLPKEVSWIVKSLKKHGFETFLVGGCVRDLLLNQTPKDFDIVTQAKPSQIKQIIHGSTIVGKRFPIVLVRRKERIYEISTFRQQPKGIRVFNPTDPLPSLYEIKSFSPKKDAWFGTPIDDAYRRDFTINALFYDPENQTVVDYVNGLKDLRLRTIRSIGHPAQRLLEDPVRILRAVRTRIKTHFEYEFELLIWIKKLAYTLEAIPNGRKRLEIIKFLTLPNPTEAFLDLYDLGLLSYLLPNFSQLLKSESEWELLDYYLNLEFSDSSDFKEFWQLTKVAYFTYHVTQDADLTGHILKSDFGAFKSEINTWTSSFKWATHWPPIERFKKRKRQRQINFLSQPQIWIYLDYLEKSGSWDPKEFSLWESEILHNDLLPPI